MKILIIDDDAIFLMYLKNILEKNNFEVNIEANPERAIKMALSKDYDFIITDYNMPEKNGIYVLIEIKKIKPVCKIILHTNCLSKEIINKAYEFGAYEVFEKNDCNLLNLLIEYKLN